MWIQYSCGSLTKIHSTAAIATQKRGEQRDGSQRSAITAYAMK